MASAMILLVIFIFEGNEEASEFSDSTIMFLSSVTYIIRRCGPEFDDYVREALRKSREAAIAREAGG